VVEKVESKAEPTGAGSDMLRYVHQVESENKFLRSEVAVKNEQIKDLTDVCIPEENECFDV